MIVNLDCSEYAVEKIGNNKIVVSFVTTLRTVTMIVLDIVDGELQVSHSSSYNELDPIFNLQIISARENKFIFGYQFGDKTKLMYLKSNESGIEVLSSRTNVDYILHSSCRINEEQILFAGPVNNSIKAWVMNVNALDFDYTTLATIKVDETSTDVYDNIVFTLIDDNTVIANYTANDDNILFKQNLLIEFNGNIDYSEPEIISENRVEILSNYINNREKLYDDLFIRVSNYDIERPRIESENSEYMKITLEKINEESEDLLEKYTVIPYLYNSLSYTMLTKNKLLVSYTARDNDNENYRLMFTVVEIKKKPDMIAVSNGVEGEYIWVAEW